ncbi:MAG: proton-conducting transporter membrane subunit [Planctomycetota bacterium]
MTTSPHLLLLPVLMPVVAAAVMLLLPQRFGGLRAWMALLATVGGLIGASLVLAEVAGGDRAVVLHVGGWVAPYGICLVGDALGATMAVMCQFVVLCGVLYAMGCVDKCVKYPAFYPLLMTLSAGLSGAMLTGDLFNFFVFAELLVISGTVLTAMSDHRNGIEAAYKYFYVSLIAASLLLVANGCLYAAYGTLNMADLSVRIAERPDVPVAAIGLVMLLAALCIKGAAAGFHFWQPDFHTTAPTPISALLSSVVVKLGIYGLLRTVTLLFPHQADAIGTVLVILGCAGAIFGGLGAAGTHDLKRMLAYSTIAQLGFILAAIGWGSPVAIAAAIIFSVNHALAKAAMLMLAGSVASVASVKSASFAVVQGVGKQRPFAGLLFLFGGLALIGLPPTNGFISKLSVLRGGVGVEAWIALGFLGMGGVITLTYVARALQKVWWSSPRPGMEPKPKRGDSLLAPAVLVTGCVMLGMWAEPLVRLADATAAWTLEPSAYRAEVLEALDRSATGSLVLDAMPAKEASEGGVP